MAKHLKSFWLCKILGHRYWASQVIRHHEQSTVLNCLRCGARYYSFAPGQQQVVESEGRAARLGLLPSAEEIQ
jgi:hypothetical protein